MFKRLCVAVARCQLLVAKTASIVWVNVVLKRRDAVRTKVKDSFLSFMDLRNSPLSGSSEFFSAEAIEKLSLVLHYETIRKAVTVGKLAKRSSKKLNFSQSAHPQQASKRPSLPTFGHPSSSGSCSGAKISSSSSRRGKGKRF